MRDQAAELRSLVLQSIRYGAAESGPHARIIALTGGKGGVGTTTLAVNLAVGLAQNAARVVLVDANLHRADIGVLCGIGEHGSVLDVLSGQRTVHEVLQRGPAGLQVIPGGWGKKSDPRMMETLQHRLIGQLKSLGRFADIVLVDVGNGPGQVVRSFWQAASEAVIVTTPDSVSVMDAYATIKTLSCDEPSAKLRLLINHAENEQVAHSVFARVEQSCQRFLQLKIDYLGHVPTDESVPQAARAGQPLLVSDPATVAAERIQAASHSLLASSQAAWKTVA